MSRRFRWTFEADFPSGKIKPQYVKVSARPSVMNDPNFNFLNATQPVEFNLDQWETISTTFYDLPGQSEDMLEFYHILGTFYDWTGDKIKDLSEEEKLEEFNKKAGTVTLKLLCPKMIFTPSQVPPAPSATPAPRTMGIGMIGGNVTRSTEYEPLEQWTLSKVYPSSVNFGELDYSSNETATIEVTWKYKTLQYKNLMPTGN